LTTVTNSVYLFLLRVVN